MIRTLEEQPEYTVGGLRFMKPMIIAIGPRSQQGGKSIIMLGETSGGSSDVKTRGTTAQAIVSADPPPQRNTLQPSPVPNITPPRARRAQSTASALAPHGHRAHSVFDTKLSEVTRIASAATPKDKVEINRRATIGGCSTERKLNTPEPSSSRHNISTSSHARPMSPAVAKTTTKPRLNGSPTSPMPTHSRVHRGQNSAQTAKNANRKPLASPIGIRSRHAQSSRQSPVYAGFSLLRVSATILEEPVPREDDEDPIVSSAAHAESVASKDPVTDGHSHPKDDKQYTICHTSDNHDQEGKPKMVETRNQDHIGRKFEKTLLDSSMSALRPLLSQESSASGFDPDTSVPGGDITCSGADTALDIDRSVDSCKQVHNETKYNGNPFLGIYAESRGAGDDLYNHFDSPVLGSPYPTAGACEY